MRKSKTYRKSRRSRKTRRIQRTLRRTQKKQRGGSDFLQEAVRIAKVANSMDEFHIFALAGSTAVHLYLHELLKHPLEHEDKERGERLLGALARPDDLDFKYKQYGSIFTGYKQSNPSNPECSAYVDLAGFRNCDPYEESPIFDKLPETVSAFSKLEFHAPSDFRRKPMHMVDYNGIPLLGIDQMIYLYKWNKVAANSPKIAALDFVKAMYEKYPTFTLPDYESSSDS